MSKNNKENLYRVQEVHSSHVNARPQLALNQSFHINRDIQNPTFKSCAVTDESNNRRKKLYINLEQNTMQCPEPLKRSPTPISMPYDQHYSLVSTNNSPASSSSPSPKSLSPINSKTIFFYDLTRTDKDGYVIVDMNREGVEHSNNIECDCCNCKIPLGDCKLCTNEIFIAGADFPRSYCNNCITKQFKADDSTLMGE